MSIDRTRTESRPATAADFRAFFGREAPHALRARALERNGEVLGLAGWYLAAGKAVVFSDMKPGIPKSLIWREARAFMAELRLPAICVASEGAGPFLERLGWVHVSGSDVGEVYAWHN